LGRSTLQSISTTGAFENQKLATRRHPKSHEFRGELRKSGYLTAASQRITPIASWHQIQDAEQFTKDLAWVAERIPQDNVRIALLGDGASWLWKAMTKCFPSGRCVLDHYHCLEHLYTVAKAQFEEAETIVDWVDAALSWLSLDQPGLVIAWLKDMKPANAGAKEEIRKLIGYLDNNRDRLGYTKRREEGLPIGSGGIESANKYISHARLKRSGAWWLIPNGNNMLRLRCAIYNGTYDRVLQRYIANRQLQDSVLGTNG
jgi:hypothetical protein